MRLLVTGGAGFIGSHFVRTGVQEGIGHITVLDKLTYAGNLANLKPVEGHFDFVHGDICDRRLTEDVMARIDVVVHFAAESHVDRSIQTAGEFVRTNVLGTQTLLDAASTVGIDTFVHVSTDEVYGSIPKGSWTETHAIAPNSPYAASKASSDLLALAYHRTHGLDVRVTRCSNNYGPFQFPEKVVPLFITRLLDNGSVPLYGDGENVRDWVHVDDHCRGLRMVLERGRPGEIYNLGGDTELTNKELTGRLLEVCGQGWDKVKYVDDRPGHDLRYSMDWSKAKAQLGYRPAKDFTSGLAETAQWYRDHRSWWEPLR